MNSTISSALVETREGVFITYMTFSSSNGMNYTFVPETSLSHGTYNIRINAQDDEGTFMNEEFVLPLNKATDGSINSSPFPQPSRLPHGTYPLVVE